MMSMTPEELIDRTVVRKASCAAVIVTLIVATAVLVSA